MIYVAFMQNWCGKVCITTIWKLLSPFKKILVSIFKLNLFPIINFLMMIQIKSTEWIIPGAGHWLFSPSNWQQQTRITNYWEGEERRKLIPDHPHNGISSRYPANLSSLTPWCSNTPHRRFAPPVKFWQHCVLTALFSPPRTRIQITNQSSDFVFWEIVFSANYIF